MTRLLVHVEGQTEETFVNELLAPHLLQHGYSTVSARLIGNARQRERRGGIKAWSAVKEDIGRHLQSDKGSVATTMVDYYALPASGVKAWPGRAEANAKPHADKATTVEAALALDLSNTLALPNASQRFVPFVVLHEFEALLFSDCTAFASGISRPDLSADFQRIRNDFATPENINDSPMSAPSKRVEALIPGYEKPLLGVLAALEIGLEKMRQECPHFADWVGRLEAVGG
ncbi:MAG: DUF4276 family protein [Rhodoferax sp.]|nr:DUF4276 family protein [Rhodoferax sp.]MDP3655170.1 DUF4276 family protein [Rhodoferax sp.]